jgi:hypothetical protein
MQFGERRSKIMPALALAGSFIRTVRATKTEDDLFVLMDAVTRDLAFAGSPLFIATTCGHAGLTE